MNVKNYIFTLYDRVCYLTNVDKSTLFSAIVRVIVVLKRTVVGDWRFDNFKFVVTNFHFQRTRLIISSTEKHYGLDSEDDFCSGCRNLSHQQQLFSELRSPARSHHTNYWYSWQVQTSYYVGKKLWTVHLLHGKIVNKTWRFKKAL